MSLMTNSFVLLCYISICCSNFSSPHRARVVSAAGIEAVVTRGSGRVMQFCCAAI